MLGTLDTIRGEVATLGMLLTALEVGTIDTRVVDCERHFTAGLEICGLLTEGRLWASNAPAPGSWAETGVALLYKDFAAKSCLNEVGLYELSQQARDAEGVLTRLLHLNPYSPVEIQKAKHFCHQVFQALL